MSIFQSRLILRLEFDGRIVHEISSSDIKGVVTVGRSAEADWRIPSLDRSASGFHARIEKRGGRFFIVDNKSRNGIYLKGTKISEHKLTVGDVYGIGDCKLLVEEDDSIRTKKAAKHHQLEQLSGENRGKVWRIKQNIIKIGSDSGCDIVIANSMVSRFHAEIEQKSDGSCWIKDLKSRNGTSVNKSKLTDDAAETGRMLKDGDIISVSFVDYRFLDRNVEHVRSHLLYKAAVVLSTIAIAVSGYVAFQSIFPSAKAIRMAAEKSAAAGDFERAKEIIKTATDARGAEEDSKQRAELIRNISLWQATFHAWENVKTALSNKRPDFNQINESFGSLLSANNDNWKWNGTTAMRELKDAQVTHYAIAALLDGNSMLANRDAQWQKQQALSEKLSKVLSVIDASDKKHHSSLKAALADATGELMNQSKDGQEIDNLLKQYDSIFKTGEILEKLKVLRNRNESRLAIRRKESKIVSLTVQSVAKNLQEPLEILNEAVIKFSANLKVVGQMDFKKFNEKLPLPSAEQCMRAAELTTARSELESKNRDLKRVSRQLENFQKQFESSQLKPRESVELIDKLFDDKILSKILEFDCFDFKPPGYTDKKPSSAYDAVLGVNTFYAYIDSLEGDFDTSIFDERFRPLIFEANDVFSLLGSFVNFWHAYNNPRNSEIMRLIREATDKNADVWAYDAKYAEITEARTQFVRKLYRLWMKNKDNRTGIVAGTMALILKRDTCGFIPEDFSTVISESFRALRKKITKSLAEAEAKSPEKRLEAERNSLELGIPGDSLLRQPWSDKFKKGGVK